MLRLFWRELFYFSFDFMKTMRRSGFDIKKILRGDTEVFTDIKEAGHGRQGTPVFDFIDIAFALTERKAHISCGNAFLCPKISQSLRKPFHVIHIVHPTVYRYVFPTAKSEEQIHIRYLSIAVFVDLIMSWIIKIC